MRIKNKLSLLIALPLIVTICFIVWNIKSAAPLGHHHSQTGQWDLTQTDLNAEAVHLEGEVEFIPGRLLTPSEFESNREAILIGRPPEVTNVSTSRIRLRVPDDGYYGLLIETIDYSDRIYINGEWICDTGKPGETRETSVPGKRHIHLTVKPVDGMIEIVQQTSNFVHKDSGGHIDIIIGSPDAVQILYARMLGITAVFAGCFLALFITHIVLYLLLRSYTVNLYASLLCLTWLLRTGVTGIKLFTSMLPWLSWEMMLRLEYLTIPLSSTLLVLTLNELFPRVFHRAFPRTLIVLSAFFAVVSIFFDTLLMSKMLVYFQIVNILSISYVMGSFAVKIRKPTLEQIAMVLGTAFLLYSILQEILFYLGIYLPSPGRGTILELGVLVYVFFQTTVVVYDTVREMSDARVRERELAAQNAMLEELGRTKNAFFTDMTHEMKTPLTVIATCAQLAAKSLKKGVIDEDVVVDLQKVSKESIRLGEMVTRLVSLSRMSEEETVSSALDLGSIVRNTAGLYQSLLGKKNNALKLLIQPGIPPISGNADELSQVLINLLANANAHTQGGEIDIRLELRDGQALLTVSDTGSGIPPELLPLVFDRFTRAGDDGTGLGLPICKEIVERHGGSISIESEQNKGTKVKCSLPVMEG